MAQRSRFCPANVPVHVVQRGNNQQACFTCGQDISAYIHWLSEGAQKYRVAVHGWVFMTNHLHLLLTPSDDTGLSKLMQYLGRQYVRSFNGRYNRSGTLFQARFRSCLVQDTEYLLNCLRYIELNPVRAGITTRPDDYHWSSYHSHAYGIEAAMQTYHDLYLSLGKTSTERQQVYRDLVQTQLDTDAIARIRRCTNTGLPFGSQQFQQQIKDIRS